MPHVISKRALGLINVLGWLSTKAKKEANNA